MLRILRPFLSYLDNKRLNRMSASLINLMSRQNYAHGLNWFGVPIFQTPTDLYLYQEIINKINLMPTNMKEKINTFNQLLIEHSDIIEYVDVEESENILVAMYVKDLNDQYEKMQMTISNPQARGDSVNRFLNTYKRYTHCEFHPMMQLGTISSNIIFTEHNQSPRNYYNFSQTKQAMGTYASNYRHRADTAAYILFHPQLPLVTSKGAKYTMTDFMPAGENIVAAIACYSGLTMVGPLS